jgi:hypothetical protein
VSLRRRRLWHAERVADESRHGATTLRPPDRSGREYDLSSTRWTFEESDDDERRERTLGDSIRGFVDRYGWRAYALPVLAVVTVAALMTTSRPTHTAAAPTKRGHPAGGSHAPIAGGVPPTVSGSAPLKTDQAGINAENQTLASDALPGGPAYTQKGDGTYRMLAGHGPVVGSGTVHHYTVDVENGVAGVDLTAFSHLVDTALDDSHSWAGNHSGVALQRVDSSYTGAVDFHVTLTSALTVRALCGFEQQIETSCWAPDHDSRVVLNVARWVRGTPAYIADLPAYHLYMINHETGHALGHRHSHACLADGAAPVMMQQTIGLKSVTGQLCEANPWPYPPGAKDAPGAESADTPQNSPLVPG